MKKINFPIDSTPEFFFNWLYIFTNQVGYRKQPQPNKGEVFLHKAKPDNWKHPRKIIFGGDKAFPTPGDDTNFSVKLIEEIIIFELSPLSFERTDIFAKCYLSVCDKFFLKLLDDISKKWPEAKEEISRFIELPSEKNSKIIFEQETRGTSKVRQDKKQSSLSNLEYIYDGTPHDFGVMAEGFSHQLFIKSQQNDEPRKYPCYSLVRPTHLAYNTDANPVLFHISIEGKKELGGIRAQKIPGGKTRVIFTAGSEYSYLAAAWEALKEEAKRQETLSQKKAKNTKSTSPTRVDRGEKRPSWFPKLKKTQDKWKEAYTIILKTRKVFKERYTDLALDDPNPHIDDYRDALASKMGWKPSSKTTRRIKTSGENGWLI